MDELGNYASAAGAAHLAGGELLLDANRMPDFFSVLPAGSEKAFTVGGKSVSRILVGKYECAKRNNHLCTVPLEMPAVYMTFDSAVRMAHEKGLGYHLMTISEWAMLCARASVSSGYVSESQPTVTGSGGWAYAHNERWTGVWDLAGNVREWLSGYRTVNGEIQIIPDNDAAAAEADELGETSTLWRAISADGKLVEPGTAGTLKWSTVKSGTSTYTYLDTATTVEDSNRYMRLENVKVGGDVGQTALDLLEQYGIRPGMTGMLGYNTGGIRIAAAGGCILDTSAQARVLYGVYTQGMVSSYVGERLCYIAEIT